MTFENILSKNVKSSAPLSLDCDMYVTLRGWRYAVYGLMQFIWRPEWFLPVELLSKYRWLCTVDKKGQFEPQFIYKF